MMSRIAPVHTEIICPYQLLHHSCRISIHSLYSAATTLVITLGNGVYGFTLDEALNEFVLTHSDMKIPARGSIYSFNEGNRWDWDEQVQDYITNIQKGCGETQRKYSGRLVGSMVADIHRTLQYGGIFGYPSDSKNANGKLRLLYEAAPMAFIVEQAGGRGTTGTVRLLNVQLSRIHERVPCILGSRDDVHELESYYNKAANNHIGATTAQRGKTKKKNPLNELQTGTNSLSRLDEMLLLEYRWQLLE
jgi:fructose-1,6-bisphosphatase